MPVLVSYPFLTIHLHPRPDCQILETEWLGFAGSEDFRQAIEQAVTLAREYHVRGWVADDRRIGPVRPKDMSWIAAYLLPTLDALGVQRFALLESGESMNRFLISNMYQTAIPTLPQMEFRAFTELAAARAWACADEDAPA